MNNENNQDITNPINKDITKFSSSITSRGLELAKKVRKPVNDDQKESSSNIESTLDFEYFLDLAIQQISVSSYQEALANLHQILTLNPDYYQAYIVRSYMIYTPLGYIEEAIKDYTQALRLNPRNHELLTNRGWANYQLGNYMLALQDLDLALVLNSRYEQGYINRGLSYMACSEYEKAINDFEQVIEINPSNSDAYNNKGLSLLHLGEYNLALTNLSRSIAINPEDINPYLNRGLCYIHLSEDLLCADSFSSAIKINPEVTKEYIEQWGGGNSQEDKLSPPIALMLVNLGIEFQNESSHQQAIELYSHAIFIDPSCEEAYSNRSITYMEINNFRMAIFDLDKILSINPWNTNAHINKGIIKQEQGDIYGAISDYEHAIMIDNTCEMAFLKRGKARSVVEDYKGAVDDFTKVIEFGSENSLAYIMRASIYWDFNYNSHAEKDAIKGFMLLGDEQSASGDYQEAIVSYTTVLELDDSNSEAYNKRSTVRSATGDYQGALEDLKKGMTIS